MLQAPDRRRQPTVRSRVRQNPDDRGACCGTHIPSASKEDRIAELSDIGQPVPAESVNVNGTV
jgi:hypothetical protein